jgi:tetratricopeptide (TPR) repeat protein
MSSVSNFRAQSADAASEGTVFARAMEALTPARALGDRRLRDVAALVEQGHFAPATQLLHIFLENDPQNLSGLYLSAEIAARQGRYAEAEPLLARCVEADPEFKAARFHFANAMLETGKAELALAQAEELLRREPENPVFLALKAMALELVDEYAEAASLWDAVVQTPAPADCWVRYAHVLRGLGRRDQSVAAYRKAVAIDPAFGRAYWGLANLKTFRFSEADIAQMELQLARPELAPEDRTPFFFALGKAYADEKLYEKSFSYYARGNAFHRLRIQHDPEIFTAYVARCKRIFTPEFFRARDAHGAGSREPIFLVGMLRAGSTLVEQILASHSRIEGTRELFNLAAISRQIQMKVSHETAYPAALANLDAATLREFGERYLDTAQPHRKLGRPFFTDKMGSNFAHLGLLHLILPNAKIVDVRRHPLACGWSNFTQLFANGQNNTYRLTDIGALYRDYVMLMAHFDRVLPGRIHRVFYEDLVGNPETEIRRLLDYLELPFEQGCLEFHKNQRAISTISSEQVRSPLYREAVEHWRHYEPRLRPLKTVLGPIAEHYPKIPGFDD